ncbi:helix-turn-helix domain-containing protein [Flavobacterium cerinum]|uniref:AraC family transcriptional regulator n=1 Tax=Flavobacterium cerinum TaxID=2502784 RepID=A0ABY5IMZ8_9FLAO|nr:AraC family transcriptional regulator [Flavobacterium cerinum]UUC44218.1 AraC family transcriptional regulator [Flavobacterium cerinum]
MKEITHIYSLKPHWQHTITAAIGAALIADKWLVQPTSLGTGGSYFLEVAPGISVIVLDLVFNQPVRINRKGTDEEFYIIHYDFSDEMNVIRVEGQQQKLAYKTGIGLGVMDNSTDSIFEPVVNERVFAIRLIVAKKLLDFVLPVTGKSKKKAVYFYDTIDSKSQIIMHRIKNKAFTDPAYDLYLRGVAFKLLAKFMDRYSNTKKTRLVSGKEATALDLTKEYLLKHLYDDFPGVEVVSEMAGMSVSKYKLLFKSMYQDSPKKFFIRKKMLLAEQLLLSGEYQSVHQIARELGYDRADYFSKQYRAFREKNPDDDFCSLSGFT